MNIEKCTVEELKIYCRKHKIKGYSRKKKNQIIELIINQNNNNNNIPEAPILKRDLFKPYNLTVKIKCKFRYFNDYIKWRNNFNKDFYFYTCSNIDKNQKEQNLKIIYEKFNLLGYKYDLIFLNDKKKTFGELIILDRNLNHYIYKNDGMKFLCKKIKDNYFGIVGLSDENFLNEDMFLREDILILYENLKNNGFDIKYIPYSNCNMDKIFKIINDNQSKNKILYHGTSKDNVNSILKRGFSLTHKITNGNVYGPGVYFTDDINFSLKYSKENITNNEKYVIICEVFIDNVCLGNRNQDMFPIIDKSYKYYDTGVDNLSYPKQFIKKDISHINILGYFVIKNNNSHIISNNPIRIKTTSMLSNNQMLNNSSNKMFNNSSNKMFNNSNIHNNKISNFDKPMMITEQAKIFITKHCKQNIGYYISKKKFYNYIYMYIEEHNLKNPINKRQIIPDKHLKSILKELSNEQSKNGVTDIDTGLTHFNLQKYINHNFIELPNKMKKTSISIENLSKHLIHIYYNSKLNNFDIYKDNISKCKRMTNHSGLIKNSKIGINTFINEEFLCGYFDNYDFIIIKIIKIISHDKHYYIN